MTRRSKRKCAVKTVTASSPSLSNGSPELSTPAEAVTQSTSGEKSPLSKPKRVVRFWDPGGSFIDHDIEEGSDCSIGIISLDKQRYISQGDLAVTLECNAGKAKILVIQEYNAHQGWLQVEKINLEELITLKKLAGEYKDE